MCEHGCEIIVPTPEWAKELRVNPDKGICIDSCIASTIEEAWERGVRTLGSCCGHFKNPPSVVITEDREMIALAHEVLSADWVVYQWQLVEVYVEV